MTRAQQRVNVTMAELRLIKDRLNGPPFNMGLSLVALDEKTPDGILQVLTDVCAELDDRHKKDVRDESEEERGARFTELLAVLKFKVPKGKECVQRVRVAWHDTTPTASAATG